MQSSDLGLPAREAIQEMVNTGHHRALCQRNNVTVTVSKIESVVSVAIKTAGSVFCGV